MRLWSIHPKYLDSKGLVAVWREALLAQKVLEGKTKGYRNHPELDRFKSHEHPLAAIGKYLEYIHDESLERSYEFDYGKILVHKEVEKIKISEDRVEFEVEHMKDKLRKRDKTKYGELCDENGVELNEIFVISE